MTYRYSVSSLVAHRAFYICRDMIFTFNSRKMGKNPRHSVILTKVQSNQTGPDRWEIEITTQRGSSPYAKIFAGSTGKPIGRPRVYHFTDHRKLFRWLQSHSG